MRAGLSRSADTRGAGAGPQAPDAGALPAGPAFAQRIPMRHPALLPIALVLTLCTLLPPAPAAADDGPVPAPDGAAPVPPAAGGEALPGEGPAPDAAAGPGAEDDGFDFRAFHRNLEAQLLHQAVPPRRTATDHGLHDIWSAVLKPRMPRMKQAVREMGRDTRWAIDPETGRAVGIAEDAWPRVVREAASLYASLGGSLEAYLKTNVRITSPFGLGLDAPAQGVSPSYPIESLGVLAYERALHRRLHGAHVVWADELHAYRALMARLQIELLRREEAWRRAEVARQRADILQEAAQGYEAALAQRVDELGVLMLSLRTLVGTLQAVEEDRLRTLVATAPVDDATREGLQAAVLSLRTGRLAARDHADDNWSRYGSLLRADWLAPRARLLKALGRAVDEAHDEGDAAEPLDAAPPDGDDAPDGTMR